MIIPSRDKLKSVVPPVLAFLLGAFFIYMVCAFLSDLSSIYSVLLRGNWNSLLMVMLVVVISGFGLFFGLTCLFARRIRREAVRMSVIYSAFLLVANFYFTALPGMSTCRCIRFKEYILSVKDWSSVELSMFLFLLNIALRLPSQRNGTPVP